jgi:hypothetical protein
MLEQISILKPSHIALQTELGDFDQCTILRQIELWDSEIILAQERKSRLMDSFEQHCRRFVSDAYIPGAWLRR